MKRKLQFIAGIEEYKTDKQKELGEKGLLHMSVYHPKCKLVNHER